MTGVQTTSTTPIERVLGRALGDASMLASLRRGIGRDLEESPGSWPYVLEVAGEQRWREPAAHLALGLAALHHQSKAQGSMNRQDWSLGRACRVLKRQRSSVGASDEGVERRFRAAVAADGIDALGVHLRGIVSLLRGAEIPLDYPRLYRDLCAWLRPEGRERTSLAWARDYYANARDEEDPGQ